jgi:hypothetical protein
VWVVAAYCMVASDQHRPASVGFAETIADTRIDDV